MILKTQTQFKMLLIYIYHTFERCMKFTTWNTFY